MSVRLSLCGVVCEAGRYLVARRNPGGSQGGKWEFPGGKQEEGETPQQTLIREFAEELSVRVSVRGLRFTGSFSNGSKDYRLEAWDVFLEDRDFRLNEHQELRWCSWQELKELDLSDSDRQVAEALASSGG